MVKTIRKLVRARAVKPTVVPKMGTRGLVLVPVLTGHEGSEDRLAAAIREVRGLGVNHLAIDCGSYDEAVTRIKPVVNGIVGEMGLQVKMSCENGLTHDLTSDENLNVRSSSSGRSCRLVIRFL